jgi:hypothetical protein
MAKAKQKNGKTKQDLLGKSINYKKINIGEIL